MTRVNEKYGVFTAAQRRVYSKLYTIKISVRAANNTSWQRAMYTKP